VAGAGGFPPRGRRRVVWAGVETEGEIGRLQRRVAEAVERAAEIEADRRPYHPHLTLARCKPPWSRAAVERLTAAFGSDPVASFRADRVSLVESELRRSGGRYRTVAAYPLAAAVGVGS